MKGHTPVRRGHVWRCTCGTSLTGGVGYWGLTGIPPGGRRAARDIMRFHRADLRMAANDTATIPEQQSSTSLELESPEFKQTGPNLESSAACEQRR